MPPPKKIDIQRYRNRQKIKGTFLLRLILWGVMLGFLVYMIYEIAKMAPSK